MQLVLLSVALDELIGAAITAGVSLLVLISTDNAVRPTNVMGASKRLAELVVQAKSWILLSALRVLASPEPVW